jgi:putative transposase
MVRAGVVNHPSKWVHSGYVEIQKAPKRYAVVDFRELSALCGFADLETFQRAHRQWVEQALGVGRTLREDRWSEAVAVGSLGFLESVKADLGSKALNRGVEQFDRAYALREQSEAYNGNLRNETEPLSLENTFFWNEMPILERHSAVRASALTRIKLFRFCLMSNPLLASFKTALPVYWSTGLR